MYRVRIGEAVVRREGRDVTIVASSFMAVESLKAANVLSSEGIDAEVIDLRSIKPWDRACVASSLRRTGRLVVADGGWHTGGVAAEITAAMAEDAYGALKAAPVRVTLPDVPAPMSNKLEKAYYPSSETVVRVVRKIVGRS